MKRNIFKTIIILIIVGSVTLIAQTGSADSKNLYLVMGMNGPGFTSPQEAVQILEHGIIPTFNALLKLMDEKKIVAGGVMLGARSIVFIVEASSNHEVDVMLRKLPAWSVLQWKVKALESISERADQERNILNELKKSLK